VDLLHHREHVCMRSVFDISVLPGQLCYCSCCHACLRISDKFGGLTNCMLYVCLVGSMCIASSLRLIWLRTLLAPHVTVGLLSICLWSSTCHACTGETRKTCQCLHVTEHHDLRTAYEISTVRELIPPTASGWPTEVSGELRITSRLRVVVCRCTADGDAEHMS
jgi:hypothetical protein